MAETAAHLTDQVFPRLPVRQWVLSVPKRLRYFLQRDTALQGAVLRILLRAVERCLREHSPGCDPTARIGAIAFIHRFGSSLNEHTHFHCCIVEGCSRLLALATSATLHPLDAEHLIYHNPKPRSDSPRDLVLTPLELIDKIAALIPPPRAHRHRY